MTLELYAMTQISGNVVGQAAQEPARGRSSKLAHGAA